MGFIARAVAERKAAGSVYERWLDLLDGRSRSKAGPSVGGDAVFRVSAAFACMREISQGIAQAPLKLMQDYQDGDLARKRVAREHPSYDAITAKPNAWQTAFELMETVGLHASLGNAYVYKNMYQGRVAELIPLHPARVRAEQKEDWTTVYHVRGKSGGEVQIDSGLIWHVRGPSWDGFLGLDLLSVAREALGLSLALEESHSTLHSNGVRPSGIYSVDATLSPEQNEKLLAWIKREATGVNAGNPLVLDRGAKWVSTAMNGVDSQHLETRQHQIEEVCRFFGVLPTIVGYTGSKANTYASAEVMETAHKVRTLGRWYQRIEASANINLVTDEDRKKGFYTKFITNALMATAAKERGEYYARALGSGGSPAFMTQDEIRALEDLDPMGGAAAELPPLINKPAAPPPTP